jgi:hypothetical protein
MFEVLWPIGASLTLLILAGVAVGRNRRIGASLAMVGYAVFGFADISKYRLIERPDLPLESATEATVAGLILGSFAVFTITYGLLWANRPKRVKRVTSPTQGEVKLLPDHWGRIRVRVYFGALLPFVAMVLGLLLTFPELRSNSYFALLGILVKSFSLLSFALYLTKKDKLFLFIALAFLLPSMVETSRRVYISVFVPATILLLRSDVVRSATRVISGSLARSTLKRYAVLLGSVIFLFVFLNFIRSGHDFGREFRAEDRLHNTLFYMKTLKSVDTFYNTGFLVESIPSRFDYFRGKTYLSVAVGLIPRRVWPSKPVGLSAPLALMRVRGSSDFIAGEWVDAGRFSLSPGFVGEAHANFGLLGILGMSILLGLATFAYDDLDRRMKAESLVRQLPTVALAPVFFLLARGDFYSAVFFPLVFSVFCYLLFRVVIVRSRSGLETVWTGG